MLRVEGLRAGYTDADILHGVEIEVEAGGFVSVLGPNGSGKSTLLRAVYGLLPPRAGSIVLTTVDRAHDLAGLKPNRITALGLNYVPQLANVFPSLSIEENVGVGLTVPRVEARRCVNDVLELFPLLRARRRARAGVLSGGQKQMLALARALATQPRLLLLDEPSAGLSPAAVEEIFAVVGSLNERGTAILMVEQNARRSLELSRYSYVLDVGRNRFEGPSISLLHDPDLADLYLGASPEDAAQVADSNGATEGSVQPS